MKKTYEKPEVEITEFEPEDICSSGNVSVDGGDYVDY
jgi:hypothetical protein